MSRTAISIWCWLAVLSGWAQLCGGNAFGRSWSRAIKQTMFEQGVEDTNSLHKIDNHIVRRLIVMPLMDVFKPNQADIMHGKVQYGDKCSLPSSLGRLMFEKRYEVPWIFEMKRIPRVDVALKHRANEIATGVASNIDATSQTGGAVSKGGARVDKVYFSPLDFRSPENYIFLPRWMMHDMGLAPNDVVDVSLVRIKLAGLVVFQPLSLEWDKLIQTGADPKTLLEQELNKYSSLTAGSTIYIQVGGKEYPLYVKRTVGEDGIEVKAVRVQDADVNTDIDRSILDKLKQEQQHS
jgi:hypothetical protein